MDVHYSQWLVEGFFVTDDTKGMSVPTEADPEHGVVRALGIELSRAVHWVEAGVHVIRSTEFDLVAGHEDFQCAVELFGEKAEELWAYLSEVEGLSENENETFMLLAHRFGQLFRELESREVKRQRRMTVSLPRRKSHLRDWQPLSTPRHSSPALHA